MPDARRSETETSKTETGEAEKGGGEKSDGPQILFYHLERSHLMEVLPALLRKSLERGARVVVQMADERQVKMLNEDLWTYAEESFLPHGAAGDGHDESQPVYICAGDDNPNGAVFRFFAGGARPQGGDELDGNERVIFIFDGASPHEVEAARKLWKRLMDEGRNLTYWKQNAQGKWERRG
jgi:DNA polymerase-3 subunit chi